MLELSILLHVKNCDGPVLRVAHKEAIFPQTDAVGAWKCIADLIAVNFLVESEQNEFPECDFLKHTSPVALQYSPKCPTALQC
jgi:hypothetical protein